MAAPPIGMLPIALHFRWIASPPFRRMAPATPPPSCKSLFAALTMASTSISVRSPCIRIIFSLILMECFAFARRSLLCNSCESFFVVTQDHLKSAKHDRAANQIWLGGHELQSFVARRRNFPHFAFAIEILALLGTWWNSFCAGT